MKLSFHEILSAASSAKKNNEKIEILRKHDCAALRKLLIYAYHPGIKWRLPAGKVTYRPCDLVGIEGKLYSEVRRLYLFADGEVLPSQQHLTQAVLGKDRPGQFKREKLFVQMLETVHPDDAKILLAMRERKLPYKGMNQYIARLAFPDMLPAPPKPEKNEAEKDESLPAPTSSADENTTQPV